MRSIRVGPSGDTVVGSGTPYVYCQLVVSDVRKARSAFRLACDASSQ